MWDAPNDPQIFGALDIDAERLEAFIANARASGHHVTPTHLVGRAIAHALVEVPDLNAQIRRGRLSPRPTVDVFFITAVSGGNDLSGVKVRDVPNKTTSEIADELTARVDHLKRGTDRQFARTKRLTDRMPPRILREVLRIGALLSEDLRLDLPQLGFPQMPFGSAMVTNVGTFGLPQGFAPLAWMYDVPLLVLVGELTEKPVVMDGRVVARRVLPITATIDHRYVDGWHVKRAMGAFRELLLDPGAYEPVAHDWH
jgi:pyruvate dehydrogenase E2 component (dihydrolipoamide acetyltransferase)